MLEVCILDDVTIAIDYASPMSSSEILKKYTWIKARKQVMDRVRQGIRAMRSSFFVHNQAEGKSPEIFETNDQSKDGLITSFEKPQNKLLSEN